MISLQNIKLSSSFGKVNCEYNWKWNRTNTPFKNYDYWYVWHGEGEVILNGQHHQVGKRDCFLFQPGDLTSAKHNPENPLTVTFIHFSLNADESFLLHLPSFVHFDPAEFHEQYLNRFMHVMLTRVYGFKQEATMLLGLLLIMFERQSQMKKDGYRQYHALNRVMLDIAAKINQEPGKQHTITNLAEQAHLSPRYFSLKFKEFMGQTIESYIIDRRIDRAEYLLRTGMTVTEVANALGYQNIYYFSRQFKQKTGVNPSKVQAWR
ncbi:AraC family transcriptional regulator [Bacillaceae bacterium SIJ1]|nr:AraC family transcriptional regulator [Litoribacterium kuwaitense]